MIKKSYTLLLGSNMGRRAAFLDMAERLLELEGIKIQKRSATYETAAWGITDQAAFLNRVLQVETDSDPLHFLKTVKKVEIVLGRNRDLKWGPRTVDIDILYQENTVLNHPDLLIPHPMIGSRKFTLVPLCEIMPEFINPATGLSQLEMLGQSEDKLDVKVYTDKALFPLFPAGPLSYWAELLMYSEPCFEVFENFPKQTYRNRIRISAANGILDLVIPVEQNHEKTLLKDVRISYSDDWQRKHWRSIRAAYQNSPYFEHYDYLLEPIFMRKYELLQDFSKALVSFFSEQVEFHLTPLYSLSYEKSELDYRNAFSAKKEYQHPQESYWQVFNEKQDFRKDLSVMDLLFNLGPEAGNYLLRQALSLLLNNYTHT